MTRVKVCGITNETDLRVAADAGADAVGFVCDVAVDTPRAVAASRAADLAALAPPFVTTTLVTMPESAAEAASLAATVGADALQVHGLTDPDEVERLRAETDAALVVAVDHAESGTARALDGVADALLVDSTTESGAGGTGRTHDWAATGELARDLSTPVVLAGGLTPENVAGAVRTATPYGVDVASGVEREGGRKDHDAVRTFVRTVRRTESEVTA